MRNFPGLTLIILWTVAHATEDIPSEELQMQSTCVANPECRYSGEPILINSSVTNQLADSISCAFNNLRAQGPAAILIDTKTGKRAGVPLGMPLPDKAPVLAELKPGESWSVGVEIYPSDLRYFGQHAIDLRAELSFKIPGRNLTTGQPIYCTGRTRIRIAGQAAPSGGTD